MGATQSNMAGCRLQSFRARRRSLARDLEAIEAIESCAQGTSQLDFSDYKRCLLVAAGNSLRNEIAVLQWNDNSLNSLLERLRSARKALCLPHTSLRAHARCTERVNFSEAIEEIPRAQHVQNANMIARSTSAHAVELSFRSRWIAPSLRTKLRSGSRMRQK